MPGNSTCRIVAKALEYASSTWLPGVTLMPSGVVAYGKIANDVVNDSNGTCSMCTLTMLSDPTVQLGPARNATVALPFGSSSTGTPSDLAASRISSRSERAQKPHSRITEVPSVRSR